MIKFQKQKYKCKIKLAIRYKPSLLDIYDLSVMIKKEIPVQS
jgi:hypothetical protein